MNNPCWCDGDETTGGHYHNEDVRADVAQQKRKRTAHVVVTEDMIERAVLAHTKAEGFISPHDDAFVSMRAALEAALEVQS
jgi:hypothetical protein